MGPYKIISFYTKNTPYEQEILNLKNSCEIFNLNYSIEGVDNFGSWIKNINHKPRFIYEKWKLSDIPIVWIDADGILRQNPTLFNNIIEDFAIHNITHSDGHREFNSSVTFWNKTPSAEIALQKWINVSEADYTIMDQLHLQWIWPELTEKYNLKTKWLPQNYAKIFDWKGPIDTSDSVVIEQFQASRRFKKIINKQI
jgi:hypothetical protein